MFGFRKRREERDALSLERCQHDTRVAEATIGFCGGISFDTLESRNLGRFLHERLTARKRPISLPVQYAIELLGGPKMEDTMSDWCRNYLENESPEVRLERLSAAVADYATAMEQQAAYDAAGTGGNAGVEEKRAEANRLCDLERARAKTPTQEPPHDN